MRMYVMNVGKNYKEAEEVEYLGNKYTNVMLPFEILNKEFRYNKIIAIVPTEESENELEKLKKRIEDTEIKKIKIENIEDPDLFFQNVLVNLSNEIDEREDKSEVHFDTTTGFKYTTTLVLRVMQIIEKEKEITIKYFYQFFDEKTKKGKLINLEKYPLLFRVIGNIEEAAYTPEPKKIEEIGKDVKKLFGRNPKFMEKLNNIKNFLEKIYEAGTVSEIDEKLDGLDPIQTYIISVLIKKIKKEFLPLIEKRGKIKSSEAMQLIAEHYNKLKRLRDAIIFLEEAYITAICEELEKDPNNREQREEVNRLIAKLKKEERGIFGNIQNWRNYLAHAGTGRVSQSLKPEKIKEYIDKQKKECKRIADLILKKQSERKIYLASSFSLNMLPITKNLRGEINFMAISEEEAKEILTKNKFISVIGHKATADRISEIVGKDVEVNRTGIHLNPFDEVIVFQLLKRFERFEEKNIDEINKVPYQWIRIIR